MKQSYGQKNSDQLSATISDFFWILQIFSLTLPRQGGFCLYLGFAKTASGPARAVVESGSIKVVSGFARVVTGFTTVLSGFARVVTGFKMAVTGLTRVVSGIARAVVAAVAGQLAGA